ncbi:MAG TPA: hypothetical protein VFK66_05795 [Oryzihumus sp.]|nr:hypothetical protein [Oryzihumus sp.]
MSETTTPSPTQTTALPPELEVLRRRRAEMGESMAAVEQALTAPAPGRVAAWAERVHAALVELSADLRVHVEVTQAPDGLFAQVVASSPRLAGAVARLNREHTHLLPAVETLVQDAEGVTDRAGVDTLREGCADLLRSLARHRQAGADLVYEAYVVDIGGET